VRQGNELACLFLGSLTKSQHKGPPECRARTDTTAVFNALALVFTTVMSVVSWQESKNQSTWILWQIVE